MGLFDFRRDHNRRTPSRRSMILQRKKKNKKFNLKKNSNKDKEKRKERTHAMLSGSVAQAPTALVTFTKRAWFVLVSRFTSEGMPPALRMVVLLAGIWAHSPKAPTTLIKTCAWKIKFMPSTRGKKYPQRTKKVNVGKRPERHIHYSPTSSLTSSSTSSPRIFQHTISYHHHH